MQKWLAMTSYFLWKVQDPIFVVYEGNNTLQHETKRLLSQNIFKEKY